MLIIDIVAVAEEQDDWKRTTISQLLPKEQQRWSRSSGNTESFEPA